ncbi:MAG: YidC/Oxa1 family insertase periplasmic-domain containing protein, partial [Sphingobacterium sp.]
MDRNNILGFILIFAILAGSFYLLKPSQDEIKKEQLLQDSIKNAANGIQPVQDSSQLSQSTPPQLTDSILQSQPFGVSSVGNEEIITLENELLIVNLTTKGGKVKSVELKNETNFDGSKLVLFDGEDNKFGLAFNTPSKAIETNDLYFQAQGSSFSVVNDESKSITFRLAYSADKYIDYIYTLSGNNYNLDLAIKAVGMHDVVDVKSKNILLNWETILTKNERNVKS